METTHIAYTLNFVKRKGFCEVERSFRRINCRSISRSETNSPSEILFAFLSPDKSVPDLLASNFVR